MANQLITSGGDGISHKLPARVYFGVYMYMCVRMHSPREGGSSAVQNMAEEDMDVNVEIFIYIAPSLEESVQFELGSHSTLIAGGGVSTWTNQYTPGVLQGYH